MEQIFIKTRLYLHTPKSTYSQIEMRIRHKGEIIRIIIKNIKVKTSQWSQCEQKAIISNIQNNIDNHNNKIANKAIEEYQTKFEEYVNNIIANNLVILPTEIKKHFNINTMGRKPLHKLVERPFDIYKWLRDSLINDNTIRSSVQSNYQRALNHFQDFDKYRQAQGYEAITDFSQIKSSLVDEFTDYLCEEPLNDGDNYVIETVEGKLKCFMALFHKYAHKSTKITKEETKLVSYAIPKVGKSESYHIALRDDEIMKLWRYKCENNFDDEVRDMFLMLCCTGLRISDINKITPNIQIINGTRRISIIQQKTQKMVGRESIGIIFQLANTILDKYNNKLPSMNGKKINENINRIARNAGVGTTEVVVISRKYANEATVRTETKDRCDMIKSHTGRRTFATILAHNHWNNQDIMLYTGHKKEDTFKKYCKKTTESQYIFDQTPPHDKLIITEEYRHYGKYDTKIQPQQQITHITIPQPTIQPKTDEPQDIVEAIAVLHMLNANPDDYIGVTDFKALLRQVSKRENEIKNIFGGGRYEFKPIFNENELPSNRRTALKELLKALEQQNEV